MCLQMLFNNQTGPGHDRVKPGKKNVMIPSLPPPRPPWKSHRKITSIQGTTAEGVVVVGHERCKETRACADIYRSIGPKQCDAVDSLLNVVTFAASRGSLEASVKTAC